MEVKAHARWTEGMQFVGAGWSGKAVVMDAAPESGGADSGARPLELLLVGLTGCTGMDVASLLRKMRVPFTGIELNVSADKSEEHPHVFTAIRLEYVVRGRDIDPDKVARAIELSMTKYCSVSAMLRKACPVEHSLRIEPDPA
ncbi:MAG: OsmC family protein [bacterium]